MSISISHICLYTHTHTYQHPHIVSHHLFAILIYIYFIYNICYGAATSSMLLKIIGLFCKRALQKKLYSAKETYNSKEPTNRSHIYSYPHLHLFHIYVYMFYSLTYCILSLIYCILIYSLDCMPKFSRNKLTYKTCPQ